jgi:hypothetical protein
MILEMIIIVSKFVTIATSGTGTVDLSEEPEFTLGF